MTFGAGRWGADQAGSRAILDAYADTGGNSIDPADVYPGGESEAMAGRFLRDRGVELDFVPAGRASEMGLVA